MFTEGFSFRKVRFLLIVHSAFWDFGTNHPAEKDL
jgi:hypothetical protein